jgi:uncharacterized cupredoxin-like copper-binding protein
MHARSKSLLAALALMTMVAAACDSSAVNTPTDTTEEASVTVAPDRTLSELVVNVTLTDEGFEPETLYLPAGQPVRMIVRNRGKSEHHYRVAGLIPSDLGWYRYPEISEDELLAMSAEELAAIGMTGDIDDPQHIVHHLQPSLVPFKETSPAGIRPLGNEVHAYAALGTFDQLFFYPLNTGTFVAEDVLHPEITGKVVVFLP